MTVSHFPKVVKERTELSFQICVSDYSVTDNAQLEEEQNDGAKMLKKNHGPIHLTQ